MKISYSISVLFLTALLVVSTKAHAADAWVLWVRVQYFWNPKDGQWDAKETGQWNVIDASSGETACRGKLAERIKRVTNPDNPPKDEDVMYKVTGDTVTFFFFPKDAKPTDKARRSEVVHYACLPDTVDPREPRVRK